MDKLRYHVTEQYIDDDVIFILEIQAPGVLAMESVYVQGGRIVSEEDFDEPSESAAVSFNDYWADDLTQIVERISHALETQQDV